MAEKQARIQRLNVYREKIAAVEEAFLDASTIAQNVLNNIQSRPDAA